MINIITQHIHYQFLNKDMFQEPTEWEISLHRRILHKIVGQADESLLGQSWDVTDFRDLLLLVVNDAVIFVTTSFYVHISLANKMGIKHMYNQSKHKSVNCGYIPCYP
jgi:hypothetical protein